MSHDAIDLPTLVREHGARLTPQRQIILDTLCALGGHVTVAEVYEQVHGRFPAIDRSTVYRALAFFDDLGLVAASEVGGVAVYEIAPIGPAAHQHLVCRACGGVEHVSGAMFEALAGQLVEAYGFAAELDSVTVEGLCAACRPDEARLPGAGG